MLYNRSDPGGGGGVNPFAGPYPRRRARTGGGGSAGLPLPQKAGRRCATNAQMHCEARGTMAVIDAAETPRVAGPGPGGPKISHFWIFRIINSVVECAEAFTGDDLPSAVLFRFYLFSLSSLVPFIFQILHNPFCLTMTFTTSSPVP